MRYTGDDILTLLNKYGTSKVALAKLLGITSMSIIRWISLANKTIPSKYNERIELVVAQIENEKKQNPDLSYYLILEEIINRNNIDKNLSQIKIEHDFLTLLIKNNLTNFYKITPFQTPYDSSSPDIIAENKDEFILIKIKNSKLNDTLPILQLLSHIEKYKQSYNKKKKITGILIAPQFSDQVKEIADSFSNIKLKEFEVILKDVGKAQK